MFARSRSLFFVAATACLLLAPGTSAAKLKVDVNRIVVELAGESGLDGVELLGYFAKYPDQLSCINTLLPYPTSTVPALAAIAAARGLKYSGKVSEERCRRILNPASGVIDQLVDAGLKEGLSKVKNKAVKSLLTTLVRDFGKEAESDLCRQIDGLVDKGAASGFKQLDKTLKQLKVRRDALPKVLRTPSSQVEKALRKQYDRELRRLKGALCTQAKKGAKSFTDLLSRYSISGQLKKHLKNWLNDQVAEKGANILGLGPFFAGAACGCPLAYRTKLSVDEIFGLLLKNAAKGIHCLKKRKYACFVKEIGFDLALDVAPEIACRYGGPKVTAKVCKGILRDGVAAPVEDTIDFIEKPSLKTAKEFAYSVSGLRLVVNLGRSAVSNEHMSRSLRAIGGGASDVVNQIRGKCPLHRKPDNWLFSKLWQGALKPCGEVDNNLASMIKWAGSHHHKCVNDIDNKGCHARHTAAGKCQRLRDRFKRECRSSYCHAFRVYMHREITRRYVNECKDAHRDSFCEKRAAALRDEYVKSAGEKILEGKADNVGELLQLFKKRYQPELTTVVTHSNRWWLADQWAKEFDRVMKVYAEQCRKPECRKSIERLGKAFRKEGIQTLRDGRSPDAIDIKYERTIAPEFEAAVRKSRRAKIRAVP